MTIIGQCNQWTWHELNSGPHTQNINMTKVGDCNFLQWFIEQEIEEEESLKKNIIDASAEKMEEIHMVTMEERHGRGIKVQKWEKIEERDVVNIRERDDEWRKVEKL